MHIPKKAREGVRSPWSLTSKWLLVMMWVLGTESWFSARAASVATEASLHSLFPFFSFESVFLGVTSFMDVG